MKKLIIIAALLSNSVFAQVGYSQYGNTRYYNNGQTAQTYGNTTYYSNGRSCQHYGNQSYCN